MDLPPRKKSPSVLVLRIPQMPIPVIRARKITRNTTPIPTIYNPRHIINFLSNDSLRSLLRRNHSIKRYGVNPDGAIPSNASGLSLRFRLYSSII
jgi:hypothetical protein